MKKINKIIAVLLIVGAVVSGTGILLNEGMKNRIAEDKKTIEEFTEVWIGNSEANQKIPDLIKEKDKEKRQEEFDALIKEGYQTCMTDKGMKSFQNDLISVPLELMGKYKSYKIQKTEITRDGGDYEVNVLLEVDPYMEGENQHNIVFKLRTQSGKVNWIKVISGVWE